METLLLLHGWGGDECSFAPILPSLLKKFNCLAPAMPMFKKGESSVPNAWTLEDYADYVENYLDQLNVKKCHILAHSFGCRVTILLALRNPDRYEKFLFTGAAGIKPRRSVRIRMKILWNKFMRKIGGKKDRGSADYRALSDTGKLTFQNVLRRDLSKEISLVQNETLLLFGKHDKATPPWMGRKWKNLSPNAKLVIYNKSGHFAYIDEKNRFISDAVLYFLRKGG